MEAMPDLAPWRSGSDVGRAYLHAELLLPWRSCPSGSMLLRMPQRGSKWLKMPPPALWRSGSIRLNLAQNAPKWLTFSLSPR